YPLPDEILGNIVRLQLDRIARRIMEHHKVPLNYDDAVVKLVVSRCTEVESGGRMIDAILTNTVLPRISEEYLRRVVEGRPLTATPLSVTDGDFSLAFAGGPGMPRQIELTTPLGKEVLLFRAMRAREELGRLSEFDLSALSTRGDIGPSEILSKNVTVRLELLSGGFR